MSNQRVYEVDYMEEEAEMSDFEDMDEEYRGRNNDEMGLDDYISVSFVS